MSDHPSSHRTALRALASLCVFAAVAATIVTGAPTTAKAAEDGYPSEVTMSFAGSSFNLLRDVTYADADSPGTSMTITAKTADGDLADGGYSIIAVDSGNNERTVANSATGVFDLHTKNFPLGNDYYIVPLDEDANQGTRQQLTLKVLSSSDAAENIVTYDGDGFTFPLGDWKIFHHPTLSIAQFHLPVYVRFSTDGRVRVGLGIDPDGYDAIKALIQGNIKSIYGDDMKKFKDSLIKGSKFTGTFSPDFQIMGYTEGPLFEKAQMTNRSQLFSLYVAAGMSFTLKGQIHAFVVDFTATGDVQGGGKAVRNVSSNDVSTWTGDTQLGAIVKAELYGGVGLQYVASLGIYANATLDSMWDIFPTAEWRNCSVSGSLGLKVKFIVWDAVTLNLVNGTYTFYSTDRTASSQDEASTLSEAVADVDSSQSYSEVSRAYLASASDWLGDDDSTTKVEPKTSDSDETTAAAEASTDGSTDNTSLVADDDTDTAAPMSLANVCKSGVFPDTQVEVTQTPTGAMMVYLDDDATRASTDRSRLMFSTYDSSTGKWSEPSPVDVSTPDGTYDYKLDMSDWQGEKNGTLYVAWQNASTNLATDSTLTNAVTKFDIYVARYDSATGAFVDVTNVSNNTSVFEVNPCVTVVGGTPYVAWSTNQTDDVFGLTGSHGIYLASPDASGTWTSTKVATTDKVITSLDLGELDGKATIAYCTDADSTSLDDITDASVWLATPDAPEAEGTAVATDGAINAIFSQKDGASVLTWSKGGNLWSLSGASASPVEEYDGGDLPETAYQLSGDLSGDAFLTYAITTDGATNVEGRTHTSNGWSKQVSFTEQNDDITTYDTTFLPHDEPLVVFSAYKGLDTDSDTDDTADLCWATADALEQVTLDDVDFDDWYEAAGNTIELKVTVTNTGAVTASGVDLDVRDENDNIIGLSSTPGSLAPGESATVTVTIKVPENMTKAQTYTVGASCTGSSMTSKQTITFGSPHLTLDYDHNVKDGQESVVFTVFNAGLTPTTGTLVIYNYETGEELERIPFDTLDTAEGFTYTYVAPSGKLFEDDGITILAARIESDSVEENDPNTTCQVAAWDSVSDGAVPETPAATDDTSTTTTTSGTPQTGDEGNGACPLAALGGTVLTVAFVERRRRAA